MQPSSPTAVEYRLQGDKGEIVFRRAAESSAVLEFGGTLYTGDALNCVQTPMGLAVSILLDAVPDLESRWLTVVIPDANSLPGLKSVPIETFAMLTTEKSSLSGPDGVTGQIQSSEIVPLSGIAW